ncbi:MAG: NusG domain II-containing protein [Bacilli bacterium]|nr:NusG domain II-containing protein [Bacilli bacterium]
MTKERKIVFYTCLVIGLFVMVSLVFMGLGLYNNYQNKKINGTLYVVIKQFEVVDEHFKIGDEGKVIFEAPFTDELYFYQRIETEYGYNTVVIENGKAYVVDADCPNPYSLNGCMASFITNDNNFLETGLIRCMQHGIQIGWEVRTNED